MPNNIIAIDENFNTACKLIGDIHQYIKSGTGSEILPDTSLFYVSQLKSLAQNGIPQFGIINNSQSDFNITLSDDAKYINISSGQIGYLGQKIDISDQLVGVVRNFGSNYGTNFVYGLRIGLPISEIQKSTQLYSSTVASAAVIGSNSVAITDISTIIGLGFPIQAYISNNFIVNFVGVSSDGVSLLIDPAQNNGTLNRSISAGSKIQFVYEPRYRSISGLPVDLPFQSGGDPSEFAYYPIIPANWLHVCDVLVQNPTNPQILDRGNNVKAVLNKIIFYNPSDSIFSESDSSTIINACKIASSAMKNNANRASVGQLISALEQYTNDRIDNSSKSFKKYWADREFSAQPYYGRGISFDGLSRFEFNKSFAQAYYDLRGSDVRHTLGIFRGDIYANQSLSAARAAAPQTVTGSSLPIGNLTGTLSRGTYVYGVTATNNAGESVSTYTTILSNNYLSGTFVNAIKFSSVAGANSYDIYRKASVVGDQAEYKLTNFNQITGAGVFMPSSATTTSTKILPNYCAIKFNSGSANYLGGAAVKLSMNSIISNLQQLQIQTYIYNSSNGNPNNLIFTGSNITINNLNSSYQNFVTIFSANLSQNTDYYLVLKLNMAPTGGTILLSGDQSGNSSYFTSTSGTAWQADTNFRAWYDLYNFIDQGILGTATSRRGIMLTGDTCLAPQKLCVSVPYVDSQVGNQEMPGYSDDSATINTNTQNEMIVKIIARNGANGIPQTFTITVPQNTVRGTNFILSSTQNFDRIDDMFVIPGTNLRTSAGTINWSVYDFVTVESVV